MVRCAVLGWLEVCENFDWGMGDCGPCTEYPDRFTYPTVLFKIEVLDVVWDDFPPIFVVMTHFNVLVYC